jgi:hypothetical protein
MGKGIGEGVRSGRAVNGKVVKRKDRRGQLKGRSEEIGKCF